MIKKSLFILLLLGFISISSNAAEDIKDIQVDGISIGDKVLRTKMLLPSLNITQKTMTEFSLRILKTTKIKKFTLLLV